MAKSGGSSSPEAICSRVRATPCSFPRALSATTGCGERQAGLAASCAIADPPSVDGDSGGLQSVAQRREFRRVVAPLVERALIQRLTHLHGACSHDRSRVAVELQTGRLEGGTDIREQAARGGLLRRNDNLVRVVEDPSRQYVMPVRN